MTDYQERVVIEKKELDEKIKKLNDFINDNPIFSSLGYAEQVRLRYQIQYMSQYSEILKERIEAFK